MINSIIRGLDPTKAYRQDKINACMLKICGNSICKSLEIFHKECLNLGLFPLKWKKENIVPTHKTGAKQCLTSPWELMDPQTKNDSDKTQDICMPYVGNGYV